MARKRCTQPLGTILMPNQVTELLLPAHMAVANLGHGCFSAANWQDLAAFSDVVQLLAADAGRQDIVNHGMGMNRTLLAIRERRQRSNKWGATGDELLALRRHITAMDAFFRRQTSHKVRAALLRLDAALARAEAAGQTETPLEVDPATLPRVA